MREMTESEILPSMITTEEIHHSIADADDIEEVWEKEFLVGDVFRNLLHHPAQLITRWNWKSVVLAVIIRGLIYLTIYLVSGENWTVTLTAVLVELPFRVITTGVAGALVQSFRKAKPIWLANMIVSIMLPAFSHTVEFAAHYTQEKYFSDILAATKDGVTRQRTFAISVLFSVVSVLFNLYAMRNGVLLVGAGEATQSLKDDFKHMPRLVGEFIVSLPMLILRFIKNGKMLYALGVFMSFGIIVGTILGAARGKWHWAWTSALGAWGLLLFSIVLTVIGRRILGHSFQTEEN
jgi:thiamine transporter ThiT